MKMLVDRNTAIRSEVIESKERWHRAQAALPVREKVRILLALQRQDLPLIQRHRPLKPWEEPWAIEP
jgi:hypothetical protein